ncbi:DUF927 domain-containing protein [Mesorhizobium sp. IMUNJ 23033]|uniref:DUF927 domain-containing protein n=1 Tax=Mesorhizobium sp. IMUNJ 23033 TaxID=3378039 RepID=UPI00384A56FF
MSNNQTPAETTPNIEQPSASILPFEPARTARQLLAMLPNASTVTLFHFNESKRAGVVTKPIADIAAAIHEARNLAGDRHVFSAITGIRLAFKDRARAKAAADRLDPSYVVNGPDDGIHLVYLMKPDDRLATLLDDLDDEDDDDAYVADDMPLAYGEYRLHEDDLAALDGGFHVSTIEEIEAAFLLDAPAGVEDAGLSPENDTVITGRTVGSLDDSPTETIGDAEVYGVISDDILKKKLFVSTAKGREEKFFKVSQELSFVDLLVKNLSKVRVGKKDGNCFVPGILVDGRRLNQAVTKLYMMGLDVDSGASMQDTMRKLQSMGLFFVAYTTHSHETTYVPYKKDVFYKWATKNGHPTDPDSVSADQANRLLRLFMTDEGKYVPDVIASAEYVDTRHDTTAGVAINVRTRSIDKFRLLFVLEEPYDISKQPGSQKDAITAWGDIILGMGRELGISVDRAARDPARLFYLASKAKGATNARIIVSAGKALDWTKIKPVSARDYKKISTDPYDIAADGMGGRDDAGRYLIGDFNLRKWAAIFGTYFEPSKVFAEHCPEHRRKERSPTKFACVCPHGESDGHGSESTEDDPGAYIEDGGLDAERFAFYCSHESCADHDPLDRIKRAIELEWFPIEALTDPAYSCMHPDDFAKALKEFRKRGGHKRSGAARDGGSGFAVSLADDGTVFVSDDSRFKIDEHEGRLWFWIEYKSKKDGADDSEPVWLPCCPVFRVESTAVDAFGGSATITIAYETRHNGPRELTFAKDLIYDRQELLKRLSSNLFPMIFENGVIDLFKLLDFPVDTMLVERTGWHGGAFLHPSGEVTSAPDGAPVDEDDTDDLKVARLRPTKLRLRGGAVRGDWSRGDLDGWKEGAGFLYKNGGVDREQFALGVMMGGAGIVADYLDLDEMPIVNFSGKTSHGKSKSAKAAATVCAAPNKRGNFHTLNKTDNSIEAVLAARSGITMIFDEGKTTTPDMLQSIIWKIASRVGKGRSTVVGDARPEKEFSGLVVMTNEIPLAQVLSNAGKKQPGGFNVRVLDIDITGVKKLEGSEYVDLFGDDIEVHRPDGVVVKEHVPGALDMMAENYGHAWRPIVLRLQELGVSRVRGEVNRLASEIAGVGADPIQLRSAKILALVWYSGVVMQELGLIPACDLARVVRWAWERRAEGTGTDDFVSAMRTLLNNAQTRHGTDITDLEEVDHWRGGELAAYRSIKHEQHDLLCISTKPGKLAKLCEVTGMTDTGLRNAMNRAGLLELEGEKKRPSWSRLPDRRSFSHWRVNMLALAAYVEKHFAD